MYKEDYLKMVDKLCGEWGENDIVSVVFVYKKNVHIGYYIVKLIIKNQRLIDQNPEKMIFPEYTVKKVFEDFIEPIKEKNIEDNIFEIRYLKYEKPNYKCVRLRDIQVDKNYNFITEPWYKFDYEEFEYEVKELIKLF